MKKLLLSLLLFAPFSHAQDCSVVDNTVQIQQALDAQSTVILTPGQLYCINGVTGLNLGSNTTLIAEGATLQIKQCAIPQVCKILQTKPGAKNWRIRGGLWLGDLTSAIGLSIGIRVDQAEDGLIEYITLRNWQSDGLQITGNTLPSGNIPSRRIEISHILSEFSVRNGMSIVNADDVFIHDSIIQDVTGNNPAACIDYEPNGGGVVNNINTTRVTARRCRIGFYDQKGQGEVGSNHIFTSNTISDIGAIGFVMNCVNGSNIYGLTITNAPIGLTIGGFAAPQNCLATNSVVSKVNIFGSTTAAFRLAGVVRPTITDINLNGGLFQQPGLGVTGDLAFQRIQ